MHFGERYVILRQIGRGSTASVFLVRDKHLGKNWVTKHFDSLRLQEPCFSWAVEQEIDILKDVRHPQMPGAIDLYREPNGIDLVMDYIEGMTMQAYVQKYGCVSETLVYSWMAELWQLLRFLHRQDSPILYCDLKPENILIQKDGRLALVDFGSARTVGALQEDVFSLTGTRGYTAPELFFQKSFEWTKKMDEIQQLQELTKCLQPSVDVYSMGAVGFFLLTGMHPDYETAFLEAVLDANDICSRDGKCLLLSCLAEQKKRISEEELFLYIKKEIKARRGTLV